jgi:hypothetical protein
MNTQSTMKFCSLQVVKSDIIKIAMAVYTVLQVDRCLWNALQISLNVLIGLNRRTRCARALLLLMPVLFFKMQSCVNFQVLFYILYFSCPLHVPKLTCVVGNLSILLCEVQMSSTHTDIVEKLPLPIFKVSNVGSSCFEVMKFVVLNLLWWFVAVFRLEACLFRVHYKTSSSRHPRCGCI